MSDLRAMLDGCRSDWNNTTRFLVLADFIDDFVGDSDWSALIRLSIEFPPTLPTVAELHPELRDVWCRIAGRWPTLWASPCVTGDKLFLWDGNPYEGPAQPCAKWKHGLLVGAPFPEYQAAAHLFEAMQPGYTDTLR